MVKWDALAGGTDDIATGDATDVDDVITQLAAGGGGEGGESDKGTGDAIVDAEGEVAM